MKNKNKELTHSHSFFEHIMDHLDHGFISELCTLIALNLFISSIHGFLVYMQKQGGTLWILKNTSSLIQIFVQNLWKAL